MTYLDTLTTREQVRYLALSTDAQRDEQYTARMRAAFAALNLLVEQGAPSEEIEAQEARCDDAAENLAAFRGNF